METILVVDDEKNYLLIMQTLLSEEGYEVLTANSGVEALSVMEQNDLDLVLTDMTMPKMDGIQLLGRIKQTQPDLPVIIMTAFGTVEKAVEAMKTGAFDYITKPFQNEDLLRSLRKALEMGRLMRHNRELTSALKERYSFGNIIGKSKPMLTVYRLIEKVSDSKATVLITGESGTGKELIAKAIHYQSSRSEGPFVAVNCSALAETLLESELFGHEKGAFTDAHATRKGRFEISHGGTLFLDEIGEIPGPLQAKLLRVLQEKSFERVGGSKTMTVDVRVIAATNRDLKQEVAEGRFREDLYYRLNVVHIPVPPLRDRIDDIPILVAHFIQKYGQNEGKGSIKVAPQTLKRIYSYPWPGNVRELENAIERAIILCRGDTVEPEDLMDEFGEPEKAKPGAADLDVDVERFLSSGMDLNDTLGAIEKKMIVTALERTGHVQAHAAELLGIKRNLMQYKMKKYGLA